MKGMPYQFGWIVDDEATANFQTRQEEGDSNGVVTGCYQVIYHKDNAKLDVSVQCVMG